LCVCSFASTQLFNQRNNDPFAVCIVDPLDGTKSYAKGQYECVSTLVAIVLDNKPIFGVICKPFGDCNSQSLSPCFAVYGGTLLNGAYITNVPSNNYSNNYAKLLQGEQLQQQNLLQPLQIPRDQPTKAIISSSRSGGIVREICTELHNQGMLITVEPILVSGAGNKALRLLVPQGGEALWPFPKSGTSLWDVAAADALLTAVGGCLTDKYGHPINYSSDCTENTSGIIASNRKDLHQACIDTIRKITATTTNYEDDVCSRNQEDNSQARHNKN
jgi:3'-phosphoadenosine 5'-phosphosulfate (PAPS) 3'-phosphatase